MLENCYLEIFRIKLALTNVLYNQKLYDHQTLAHANRNSLTNKDRSWTDQGQIPIGSHSTNLNALPLGDI
jgi:hypothetical protein